MNRPVVEQIRTELVTGTERYERLRRRRVVAFGTAVVLVVVASAVLVWSPSSARDHKVFVQSPSTSSGLQIVPGPLAGLQTLPPAPDGDAPLPKPVWTGSEFLFVGITDDDGTVASVAFDVRAGTWRRLSPPPPGIGEAGAAVWTGRELFLCCGGVPEDSNGAAAYDPAMDTWRRLSDSPVHGYATAVWTGRRVVVAGNDGVASFDPSSNEWTVLPTPPELASFNRVVSDGGDIVVWPAPGSRSVHSGEVFASDTETWSKLPDPPSRSWPGMPEVVRAGDALFLVGALPAPRGGDSERFVAARYEPSTNAWVALPDPLPEPRPGEGNLGSHTSLWTGRDLLVQASELASGLSAHGALMAYDPARNAWRLVGKTEATALRPIAMAGNRVLFERNGRYFLSESDWRPDVGAPRLGG